MALHASNLHTEVFHQELNNVTSTSLAAVKREYTYTNDNNNKNIDLDGLSNKDLLYDKAPIKPASLGKEMNQEGQQQSIEINNIQQQQIQQQQQVIQTQQQAIQQQPLQPPVMPLQQPTLQQELTLPQPHKDMEIQQQQQQQQQQQSREVNPPTSIYGIESLTSKPYDPNDMKVLPEIQSPRYLGVQPATTDVTKNNAAGATTDIHSPRYPGVGGHGMAASPHHHSSPDRDPNRLRPPENQTATNWGTSPVKQPQQQQPQQQQHNYRAPAPPTSPYVDGRDPNYPGCPPRRYVQPFYGNGRNFTHPTADGRNRYTGYPVGSPMLTQMGYPREGLDNRYNLHMGVVGGFPEPEDKFKLSPPSMDDKHIWTKQEVELLLDLYEEHKVKLQDPRVRKTKVWEDIAKEIHEKLESDVNGCQCNQKFRNMKADFQKVVEHNSRSGSFRKTCKYYERLEKLLTPMSETEKLKEEVENETKFYNGFNKNAPSANAGFYSTSSSESGEQHASYTSTPSSPEKRPHPQMEVANGGSSSPPPAKRACIECGGMDKQELMDVLKEFLKEQRKREDETINKIHALHKEKIDTVVKFLDLFQELVKKV